MKIYPKFIYLSYILSNTVLCTVCHSLTVTFWHKLSSVLSHILYVLMLLTSLTFSLSHILWHSLSDTVYTHTKNEIKFTFIYWYIGMQKQTDTAYTGALTHVRAFIHMSINIHESERTCFCTHIHVLSCTCTHMNSNILMYNMPSYKHALTFTCPFT